MPLSGVVKARTATYIHSMMILFDSFDLKNLREFACPICFEPSPVTLGEKWQVCPQFHFTKTKTICPTDRTIDPNSAPSRLPSPHPHQ
jgi:hypothetical protein